MTTITLHIDRLVLDGLPLEPRHAPLVEAAIGAELARLFATGIDVGALSQGSAIRPPPLALAHGPEAIGAQVASAIHKRLGQ